MSKLAEVKAGAPHPPIVRYSYRSFDRQWAFDDPRWAKTESPSLWWSASSRQLFMTAMMTNKMGHGPAATAATAVPDFHHVRGSYGGKDVIPLYRNATGTPNIDPSLLDAATARLREGNTGVDSVSAEELFAYVFGVLAGTDYTARFRDELETPGPRIPLSADPKLFKTMAAHGEHLLWLQTFGERFAEGDKTLPADGVTWTSEPSRLPADRSEISYDADANELHVADGLLTGVTPEVYAFGVSGMEVIPKWLGYRMVKPPGRAASSKSPLDKIRPDTWSPEWSNELVEIVAVLKQTLAAIPDGVALLDQILAGPLIAASELPEPPAWMRQPPKSKNDDDALFSDEGLA